MTQAADSGRILVLDKEIVMTTTELTPVVTHEDDGLTVVEYTETWYDSDDLGYFAEYVENM